MNRFPRALLLLAALAGGLPGGPAGAASREPPPRPERPAGPADRMRVATAPADLDLEENRGQADRAVRFLGRGHGFTAFLTDDEAVFALIRPRGPLPDPHVPLDRPPAFERDVVRMRFPGADPAARFEPSAERPGRSNHFRGRDPSRWVTGVRRFGEVLRRDAWPGVDLRWRGTADGALEYDFLIHAGADPGRVALAFEGAAPRVDPSGDLLLDTAGGTLRHGRPVAWQERGGRRLPVEAAFAPGPDGTVGFALGAYDPALPVVLDPKVTFGANTGGSSGDEAWGVAIGPEGSVHVAGFAHSTDFPVKNAYQSSNAGDYDVFVAKQTGSGTYTTYLGGAGADLGFGLAVGPDGSAVVVGGTFSDDFPVKAALQPARPHTVDDETGFVARIGPAGSTLSFSTYLGGGARDGVRSVALRSGGESVLAGYSPGVRAVAPRSGGNLVLGGYTASTDFPLASALQGTHAGSWDAFVAEMDFKGGSLRWSTFYGGSGREEGRSVALTPDGSVLIAGHTDSLDLPTTPGAFHSYLTGSRDGFAAKIASDGSATSWATYLGGGGEEEAWGVCSDAEGLAWVVGYTTSTDLPLAGAVDSTYAGDYEAFASRIAADGGSLDVSTYLGGGGDDKAEAVAVDSEGAVAVVGRTNSSNFPTSSGLQGPGGLFDAFVTVLKPGDFTLLWSTYLGGSTDDFGTAVAAGPDRTIYVAGRFDATGGPDAFARGILAPPYPPTNLSAVLVGLVKVDLRWTDKSSDETGFRVERRTGSGPYVALPDLEDNVRYLYEDDLEYATTYTYRVRSFNGFGFSPPSNEVRLTTLPYPTTVPDGPSGLDAVLTAPHQAVLTWTDNSHDEDTFEVDHAAGAGPFALLESCRMNVATATVAPSGGLTRHRYRVRAVNPLGSSTASAEAEVVTPATLDVFLEEGRVLGAGLEHEGSLRLEGSYAFTPTAGITSFDRVQHGFEFRFGDEDAPPFLSIPAGSLLWKSKVKKLTWKLPSESSLGRVVFTLFPADRSWTLVMSRATLPVLPANPVRLTLTVGPEAGSVDRDWVPGKVAGELRYP
jgi:hypothetical protein